MMSTNKQILIPFFLLLILGSYTVYQISPELTDKFGYNNPMHFFIRHMLAVLVGIGLMFIANRLENPKWFDQIGTSILVVSILLMMVMLFAPSSMAPYTDGHQIYLHIGSISIAPVYFYIIGLLWMVDWARREENGSSQLVAKVILSLIVLSTIFSYFLHYIYFFVLIELLLLLLLLYIKGAGKYFGFALIFVAFIGVLFILMSPHRMHRIETWWKHVIQWQPSMDIATTTNRWDEVIMFLTVTLVIWLSYLLIRTRSTFTVGVGILLLIANFVMLPLMDPMLLYITGYGHSITIASFLMLAMVMIKIKEKQTT